MLHQLKEDYGLARQLKRVGYFLLVVVAQVLLFMLTNWLFRKLRIRIERLKETRLKPIMIQTYELLNTDKQVRLLRYLAMEIEEGRLQINGFYNDWAMPTYHIVRFLLYAFMIAMIYPYLPGSNSGVFQGISVFVGLIVSLGSTAVIGNIIAGLVITYMRPFKLGDFIKLNDTSGNVIEKTPLVTRIRTHKNEVVTIPNSFMMSSHTINYSSSAKEHGLIIHSEVTIG